MFHSMVQEAVVYLVLQGFDLEGAVLVVADGSRAGGEDCSFDGYGMGHGDEETELVAWHDGDGGLVREWGFRGQSQIRGCESRGRHEEIWALEWSLSRLGTGRFRWTCEIHCMRVQ